MNVSERLVLLRKLQQSLDAAFRIPGTRMRFGWDSIIGLIPGGGDTVTGLLACAFVVQAFQMRLPKVVQLRIILNIVIDMLIGLVPIAGDVADLFWKANTRNLALIERHADEVQPASIGDWLFVLAIAAAIAFVVALPFIVLYWMIVTLEHAFVR